MSFDENIKHASDSIVQIIMDSPKTAQLIPWGTAVAVKAAESATRMDVLTEVQAIVSIVAAIMGIAVSAVVFYHWIIKVDIAKMDRRAAQLKAKELDHVDT